MFAKLWRFLFYACKHKWEIMGTGNVYRYETDKLPISTKYHLRCTKCGNIKKKEL